MDMSWNAALVWSAIRLSVPIPYIELNVKIYERSERAEMKKTVKYKAMLIDERLLERSDKADKAKQMAVFGDIRPA